jgi:hypothetical protein
MKPAWVAIPLLAAACSTLPSHHASLKTAVSAAVGEEVNGMLQAEIALDSDTWPDALVLITDNGWCGSGGCLFLVFKGSANGYSLVSRSTVTSPPIRILESSHLRWKDLIVHSNGVGDVFMQFDGTGYPSNPSLEPHATTDQLRSARTILDWSTGDSSTSTSGGTAKP